MTPVKLVATCLALLIPTSAIAQSAKPRVYAYCTVRDLNFEPGKSPTGKLYRSEVFSAPAASIDPEGSGPASREFEKFVWQEYGLRPDRTAFSGKSENYCIQAPDTARDRSTLERKRQEWDSSAFPDVELVLTTFIPKAYRPSAKELEYEAQQRAYEQEQAEYERGMAEHRAAEEKFSRDKEAAARSAQQAASELALYQAELKRVQASQEEFRRKRLEYEREYERITGTKPPPQ